jgi:hypothetical protein
VTLPTYEPGDRVVLDEQAGGDEATVLGACAWQTNTYRVRLADGRVDYVNPTRMRLDPTR